MRVLKVLLCAGVLGACTAEGGRVPDGAHAPGLTRISGVPFLPQDGRGCGPSSLAMVLGWTGLDVKPDTLAARFALPGDPRPQMVRTASLYGRLAYPVSGMAALVSEVENGHPVLLVQNLGVDSRPIWNCLVAVGLDRSRDEIVVHSGNQAGRRMPARAVERLGAETDHWGLVVLKPGELPTAATLPAYLSAARALEQAGRYWEAVMAYDAALTAWPDNAETLMGLGGSLYLLGDPRGAADAYRAAASTAGDPAPARAALARIAAELARPEPAVSAVMERPLKASQIDN